MPSPNSVVRLKDGRTGTIDRVTPDGKGDQVLIEKVAWSEQAQSFVTTFSEVVPVTAWDIDEVLWEPDAA